MSRESVPDNALVGLPPQLDLFERPIIQGGVERAFFVEYRPTNQISSQQAPVSFVLGGDSKHYLDLRKTKLYVKAKITKEDGTKIVKDDPVATVNLTLHSMWSQVDIKISGHSMSLSDNSYPYKSYFQTLLKTSSDVKDSQLCAQMYFNDDGDKEKVTANTGCIKRLSLFSESSCVEMEGPLLEDICQTSRYILNNTQIEIKLFRSRPEFVIMTENDEKYQLHIEDICLKACYIDVNPGVITGHAEGLRKSNAIYPFIKVQMKSFHISTGARNFNWDNLFNTECPTKVLVGFVESDSFSGNFKKNPFNFQHFDLSEIELCCDGTSVPSRPMKVNFDGEGREVVTPFLRLHECLGGNCGPSIFGSGLTMKKFANGYTIYSFPVYGGGGEGNFIEIKKSANVRIQGTFSKPLSKAVTAVIYGEFPSIAEIEDTRNVIVN